MNDTPPEIAEMVRARLVAMSGAERFLIGISMFAAARDMVLASLPHNLSDEERRQRLFERLYNAPFSSEPAMKITERRPQTRGRTGNLRERCLEGRHGGDVERERGGLREA